MASKAQQQDWLALLADSEHHAPPGFQLKQWLFGGQSISTKVALFPIEDYPGLMVCDLFGEDSYFADADLFWEKQNAAIAARRDAYLEAGWAEVVVLEPGQYFHSWDYEKTPKKKGGKVVITVSHRHAAVRAAMLDHAGTALRLMVAHAISGSGLWHVRPEPQRAANEAVAASLANGKAEAAFAEKRRAVLALLNMADENRTVAGGKSDDHATASVFGRLLALPDEDVMRARSPSSWARLFRREVLWSRRSATI
ncbi:hypothetical protein ACFSOZ_17320 [Mesorhizobium newzealandense]|uniref:Chromosome partitioning protein ParB n=1 Tax=Mesorhizobium newzealandense TaxID=1300302 RepID=A0ABW4UDG6_9HYPH